MTISSSLNSGVAGLSVNASKLATISDNIANSGTYGYKRANADFHSMVSTPGEGSYSAGGVRVTTGRMIDQSGTVVSTDNPTDLSVFGGGMLPVTSETALDIGGSSYPTMLTTTGSFRADANGVLKTDTGLVLMGWPANSDGVVPAFPRDSAQGLEPVRVDQNQFAGDPTTTMDLDVNLPATSTEVDANGDSLEMSVEYFDNMGRSQNLNITYTPTVPASGSPTNEWTMSIRDTASNDAVIGEYIMTFDDARGTGGNLATVVTTTGGTYDPLTGGFSVNVDGGPLEINVGLIGDSDGFTQLSSSFSRSPVVKDGSAVGNLTSVEMDADGFLHAIYDSGSTRTIYQVPLADVPNPNGLLSVGGQAYQVSAQSGPLFLWNAGSGPTGEILGYSREESTTDVADELTQMIETQRAYSSSAKIIQTVDEMLQETTNIKR